MAVMVERPVVRGRILQGTSSKRKRRRCNTTRASISGYSSGKAAAEHIQREPIDAHETGSGIVHRLAENRPQHEAKEADAERANQRRSLTDIVRRTASRSPFRSRWT